MAHKKALSTKTEFRYSIVRGSISNAKSNLSSGGKSPKSCSFNHSKLPHSVFCHLSIYFTCSGNKLLLQAVPNVNTPDLLKLLLHSSYSWPREQLTGECRRTWRMCHTSEAYQACVKGPNLFCDLKTESRIWQTASDGTFDETCAVRGQYKCRGRDTQFILRAVKRGALRDMYIQGPYVTLGLGPFSLLTICLFIYQLLFYSNKQESTVT